MPKKTRIRPGIIKDIEKYKKTIIKFFFVLMVSLSYFGAEFSYYFQANILMDITHDPIDGFTEPTVTVDWAKLTDTQFNDIRLGKLTYDNIPKELIIKLPKYDKNILAKERTDATSTLHNTYLTAWLGEYTIGMGHAIEGEGSHPGIDIRAPLGTPVFAIANGIVVKAQKDSSDGNYVVLRHDINPKEKISIHSSYLHLEKYNVVVGEIVKKGQQIGTVGSTGISTTYHLHFQIDNEEAPYNTYWPFTWKEAETAKLNFFEAVNEGLGLENARKYTVNPMEYVYNFKPQDTSVIVDSNNDQVAIDDNLPPVKEEPKLETPKQTETKPIEIVNQNPVASIRLVATTEKFIPNTPVKIELETVDTNGNKTTQPLFGELEAKDLNGKPLESNIEEIKINNGKANLEVTPLQGAPYKVFVGSGIINGVVDLYPAEGSSKFSDVKQEDFAYEAIKYFSQSGLVKGYSDGKFHPEKTITRAELTKIIMESLKIKLKSVNAKELPSDIKLSDWHSQYLYTARSLNIIKGFSDGTLRPNDPVTQAQAIKIALIAGNKIKETEGNPWYIPYKDKLDRLGINPFIKYSPDQELRRDEAVQLLYQMTR